MSKKENKPKKKLLQKAADAISGKKREEPVPESTTAKEPEEQKVTMKPKPLPNVSKMSYGELLKSRQEAQAERARKIREANAN